MADGVSRAAQMNGIATSISSAAPWELSVTVTWDAEFPALVYAWGRTYFFLGYLVS